MALFSYAHSMSENALKGFIQLTWMVLKLVRESVLTSGFRIPCIVIWVISPAPVLSAYVAN